MKLIHIRDNIITPALIEIGHYSDDARDMVLATGLVESHYHYVRQINGPALGWFQMEPATHNDIFSNFLGATSKEHVLNGLNKLTDRIGVAQEMEVNPFYAAAMCRIHYMRDKQSLPSRYKRMEQAEYWKRVYNTKMGKGTVGGFMEKTKVLEQIL